MHTIYLRETQDWENTNEFIFPFYLGELAEQANELMKIWNQAFRHNFCEFRAKLKEISLSNWPLHWTEEIDPKDNDLIIPTDDDDWFHPALGMFLDSCSNDAEFIYWETLECFSTFAFVVGPRSRYCPGVGTNGYAIRGRLLKRMSDEDRANILKNHSLALQLAEKYDANIDANLNLELSCHNRHPASASSLWIVRDYLDIRKILPKKAVPLHPRYNWMQDEYSQLFLLVNDLVHGQSRLPA